MTFEEALQAIERAKEITAWVDIDIRDEFTQAIEVFKQMNDDLNQCKVDLKLLEMLSKSLG